MWLSDIRLRLVPQHVRHVGPCPVSPWPVSPWGASSGQHPQRHPAFAPWRRRGRRPGQHVRLTPQGGPHKRARVPSVPSPHKRQAQWRPKLHRTGCHVPPRRERHQRTGQQSDTFQTCQRAGRNPTWRDASRADPAIVSQASPLSSQGGTATGRASAPHARHKRKTIGFQGGTRSRVLARAIARHILSQHVPVSPRECPAIMPGHRANAQQCQTNQGHEA